MHIYVYLHNFRIVDTWDNPVDNNSGTLLVQTTGRLL